jgi:hypothetical protein
MGATPLPKPVRQTDPTVKILGKGFENTKLPMSSDRHHASQGWTTVGFTLPNGDVLMAQQYPKPGEHRASSVTICVKAGS